MTLSLKQRVILRTLRDNVLCCKTDYVNNYEKFYLFYLKMLEKYENFDDINYVDKEKLLHLKNVSIECRTNYEKSLRAYYNYKVLVQEEEDFYSTRDLKDYSRETMTIYNNKFKKGKVCHTNKA